GGGAGRGKLVVVDPRRTETAGIANEHLFIRPGSDAWFLVALLQEVVALGAPRTEAYAGKLSGLDLALAAVAAVDTRDVEALTGIPRATLARIAAEFRAAPAAVAYGRMGVSTQAWGTLCQWLIQLLNLVTGNLDREGGSLPNEAVLPVTGPGTSPGNRGRWHSRVRGLPEFSGELPVAVLAEEILTPGEGQVRALLTCAGNPVLSTPDGRGLDKALSSLDFMVSIDIYLNETTRHADLILPPASPLTQPHYDVHFNSFAVRRVAKLSLPLRERGNDERADWEIINGIAAAYAAASGKPVRDLPPPLAMIGMGLARGGSGITVEQLSQAPHGLDLGPLRPSLLARLETASGCIECAPPLMLEELRRLAMPAVAASDTTLRLIGRRDVRSNNSWMHNAPRLVKGKTRHHLLMHPDDLASRGIGDGARVAVSSSVGSIEVEVRGSDTLMPGVACLPHGFGHDRAGTRQSRASAVVGPSYNDLTDAAALDLPSGNAALNGVEVRVRLA
ncbi:MAG: molybdopterin-dependent oxidoreductase, partial [Arenimonas sp.]|uniref:molybdopterin dinucleotide binding domain-containing protein n=1 Tax=Arenimonas sp. TaxID=1872635 RepID=UPI0025BF9D1F